MTVILADIGGTHARFAMRGDDHTPRKIRKYAMREFSSLPEALSAYSEEKGTVYIATAAWPHSDGTWHFARPGRWVISKPELEQAGWQVAYIGNDFGAGARGVFTADDDSLYTVQRPSPNEIPQNRYAVLGSGTGLGLAYVCEGKVHETYGGHMEVPQRTDEQHTVINLVARLKDNDRPVIAEDIISGPGLVLLYHAACMLHGIFCEQDIIPETILEEKDRPLAIHALRLYHEFLGMFAHQAVIYGHAYAGLYMDGGVLHRLVEANVFDTQTFTAFFIGDPLPLIKNQMQAMAVKIVTDPYITLRGLAETVNSEEAK